MKKLVAKIPILYQGRMYAAGEDLPAYEPKMVDAWLRAKSAEMVDTEKIPNTPENPQEPPENPQEPPEDSLSDQGSEDSAELHEGYLDPDDLEKSDQGSEDSAELHEGYLDPDDLEKMDKDDLKALAKQLAIEIPRGATKTLIIEKLAATVVQAPVNDGDAQE